MTHEVFIRHLLKKCSGGMSEVIPHLYIGSLRDACDEIQLKNNKITHIVSVHDMTKCHPVHEKLGLKVLRVRKSDRPDVDLIQCIPDVNNFVHEARLNQDTVLVHCLAGVSRSSALVLAYLLTITDGDYWLCLNVISMRRKLANPNFGFRMQLSRFATSNQLSREKLRLKTKFSTKWESAYKDDSKNLRKPLHFRSISPVAISNEDDDISKMTDQKLSANNDKCLECHDMNLQNIKFIDQ